MNSLLPSLFNSSFRHFSRVYSVQHARERNRLAHVLQPADPRHRTLDSHAEAGMRHPAVLPQVEIPFEGLFWQVVFMNSFEQGIVAAHTLRAANDLAIT